MIAVIQTVQGSFNVFGTNDGMFFLEGNLDVEQLKELKVEIDKALYTENNKRAFDRDDKRVVVGNTVRVVQGELGFDWDMDEPARVVSIPAENQLLIKWDDDQQLEMASYDVRIDD